MENLFRYMIALNINIRLTVMYMNILAPVKTWKFSLISLFYIFNNLFWFHISLHIKIVICCYFNVIIHVNKKTSNFSSWYNQDYFNESKVHRTGNSFSTVHTTLFMTCGGLGKIDSEYIFDFNLRECLNSKLILINYLLACEIT